MSPHFRSSSKQQGFTLVEIVVGIVVMAIALTLLTTVFFSSAGRSVEPMLMIRGAEFGQALMDEIIGKKFDEQTPDGGVPACSAATTPCSDPTGLNWWDDGEARITYDDVDDYNVFCGDESAPTLLGWPVTNALGAQPNDFENFRMRVCVGYDADYDGNTNENAADNQNAKLISVEILVPQTGGLSEPVIFRAYKGNY